MNKNLILIGGGGHCVSSIDVIESTGKWDIAGIVDTKDKLHQKVSGYEIIASDEDLPNLVKQYEYFSITLGFVSFENKRIKLFNFLKESNVKLPTIISPLAYIAKNAFIDEGSIVMHRALINSNVHIGKNSIINTFALIEHDSKVGDHCHISTGSIVNGNCKIGNSVFVGSNSTVLHTVTVTDNVIVGAASVVINPINQSGTYVGNPTRRVSTSETYET